MRSVLMLLCLFTVGYAETAQGSLAVVEYFAKDGDVYCREKPTTKSFWPEFGKDIRGNVFARIDVVREYKLDGDKWVVSGVPKDAEKLAPKNLDKDQIKKPHEEADFIAQRWDGTTFVHLKGLSEKDLAALWEDGELPAEYQAVLVKNPPEVVYFRLSDEKQRSDQATPGNLKLAKAIKLCAFPPKEEAEKKGGDKGKKKKSASRTAG